MSGRDVRPIDRLLAVMAKLRDPEGGCPWDLAQDWKSLAPYTLEEACEVVDALERGDRSHLREELGDLLFQVVFLSQLAREEGAFDFDAVAEGIASKLEERHPHVFGPAAGGGLDAPGVLQQWEARKAVERASKGSTGVLAGVPLSLPALLRAAKLGRRAARVGFDWPDAAGARAKLDEELREVEQAQGRGGAAALDEELGDALFAMTHWVRLLGRDPEALLRAANRKFEARFARMEAIAAREGLSVDGLDAAAWDRLWESAKAELAAERAAGAFSRDSLRRE